MRTEVGRKQEAGSGKQAPAPGRSAPTADAVSCFLFPVSCLLLPALCLLLSLSTPLPLPAQQSTESADTRLRAERQRLEKLKSEREALEKRRANLQNTVHDLSEEVENIKREAEMTAGVVRSLDSQLETINGEVAATTSDLVAAQDELTVKRVALRQRLVDIYKRGPLYTVQVLLSATSFGDLVARYKYLHLLTLRDRALVGRVEALRNEIDRQHANLVRFQRDIEVNLQEKAAEERRLRDLQEQQARSLTRARRSARDTEARLQQISRDEQRLADVIASLEAARKRAEAGTPAAGRARSAFAGVRLDWPVAGDLIYNFGRVVNPNNTTVRWNGIGIKAATGTPVHAVASGKVLVAEPFGTYGLTVIIQHLGGDYSVYGSLSRLAVSKGDVVSKGQVIGYVGASDPELGSHLHFELRPGGRAADPLDYLGAQP
jgi:septal ring factor EnvC (AmiA/AmiB activator)